MADRGRRVTRTTGPISKRKTFVNDDYDNERGDKRARSRSNDRHGPPSGDYSPRVFSELSNIQPVSDDVKATIEQRAKDAEIEHRGIRESSDAFVGNLPVGFNKANELIDFLTTALHKLGLVHKREDPIKECRMNTTFCFVEFRTIADCVRALNLTGIPFKGSPLKINRPAKYTGPATQAMNWHAIVRYYPSNRVHSQQQHRGGDGGGVGGGGGNMGPYGPASQFTTGNDGGQAMDKPRRLPTDRETKPFRELFLGNLSAEIPAMDIREYLGSALRKMGMSSSGTENPIHMVTINGKYGFVETRTIADATNLLNFTDIPFFGINIMISRPIKFVGAVKDVHFHNWNELIMRWQEGDIKLLTAGPPSCVLVATNMASSKDLQDPDCYLDIIEDTRNECSLHGAVKQVIVPRVPSAVSDSNINSAGLAASLSSSAAAGSGDAGGGGGRVFIEMGSVEFARNALLGLKGREYNGRIVDVKFYPEHLFYAMNYTYNAPDLVVTASDGAVPIQRIFDAKAMAVLEKN